MAVRVNEDGSISVGILPTEEDKPMLEKVEKPKTVPAKKAKKAKAE